VYTFDSSLTQRVNQEGWRSDFFLGKFLPNSSPRRSAPVHAVFFLTHQAPNRIPSDCFFLTLRHPSPLLLTHSTFVTSSRQAPRSLPLYQIPVVYSSTALPFSVFSAPHPVGCIDSVLFLRFTLLPSPSPEETPPGFRESCVVFTSSLFELTFRYIPPE